MLCETVFATKQKRPQLSLIIATELPCGMIRVRLQALRPRISTGLPTILFLAK